MRTFYYKIIVLSKSVKKMEILMYSEWSERAILVIIILCFFQLSFIRGVKVLK